MRIPQTSYIVLILSSLSLIGASVILLCTRWGVGLSPDSILYVGAARNLLRFDPTTGKLTPFFNPRKDVWSDHFEWDGPIIQPLTAEGRVTVKIFRFNDPDRVEQRRTGPEAPG